MNANGTSFSFDVSSMKRYPSSGLSVLVVGGGIAGLGFAIEAHRKGHDVKIIERRPDFNDYGDLIAIQESALISPAQWPGFLERCHSLAFSLTGNIRKYDGTLLGRNEFALAMTRADFHRTLHEYAQSLNIEIQFSTLVTDYFESEDQAGVILENGRKVTADIVVSADGVGSKSWNIVSGFKEKAISSGFAVFRATYPLERVLQNPVITKEYGNASTVVSLYFGPGAHIILAKNPKSVVFMLTHKDNGNAEEEWTKETSVEHALPHVEGWAPFISEIIKSAPGGKAVDFKLMWRNPRENWSSPKKRIIQIGDAAHTFLPTSASGATMALEDAFSLAACLQLAGKSNAPLGVHVHNHLRAERVSCAQKMGFKTRELFHNPDWDAMANDPSATTRIVNFVGSWVRNHDPEQYAYDNYGNCANHLQVGTPFKNTNAVPGYTYKPWTVQELLSCADRGERIVDEGDWN